MSITTYSFGDVVLVRYPFTNQQDYKQRPAVVIGSSFYDDNLPDVVLMPISSQIRMPLRSGELLIQDWRSAGLLKPSVLKPIIATMDKSLPYRALGRLQASDIHAVSSLLELLLGKAR